MTHRPEELTLKLRRLFTDELEYAYWSAQALIEMLYKVLGILLSVSRLNWLNTILMVSEQHVRYMEKVFELLGDVPTKRQCEAMNGLIKKSEELLKNCESKYIEVLVESEVQKLRRFQHLSYRTLCTFARKLDLQKVAEIFNRILREEDSPLAK